MRLIAVCGSAAAFCVAIFLSLRFLPQTWRRFPDAGTYHLVVLSLLTVVVLCLLVSFWRRRGRYFTIILAMMVIAMIAASIINWLEMKMGAGALWNGCLIILLVGALFLMFKKRRTTGV